MMNFLKTIKSSCVKFLSKITSIKDFSNKKFIEEIQKEKNDFAELGFLAASIEHEIRNPLATIDNLLHRLLWVRPNDENVIKIAKQIKRETNRISASLQLVYIIRLSEPDSRYIKWERIRLEDFLRGISKRVRGVNKDKIFFRFEGKDSLSIVVQPNLLEMAFKNLFVNAAEAIMATKQKKGVIDVNFYLDRKSERVVINVKDNGCGIPEDIINELMNPGFSTKPKVGNSGLGLFVVYKIIKLHKGEISFIRNEEKGTTVSMSFPNKY